MGRDERRDPPQWGLAFSRVFLYFEQEHADLLKQGLLRNPDHLQRS